MAYLLQGLILCAALASAAPFSHKQHLALKLVCATCHQSVAQSKSAADNNLPDVAVCASCHKPGEVSVKTPSARTVDKFNHALHTKMGNLAPAFRGAITAKTWLGQKTDAEARLPHLDTKNACAGCHQGIEQSEAIAAQTTHFPHMADCLTCHNKIDPPFSCEQCHSTPAKLQPASHSPGFIDRHNRFKDQLERETCTVCHGREFRCLGCH